VNIGLLGVTGQYAYVERFVKIRRV
jgi:hypothetical protein